MKLTAELLQRAWRRLDLIEKPDARIRRWYFSFRGAEIGERTKLPKTAMTWPHQVKIGRDCILEENIYFKYSGSWTLGPSIVIGDGCFIGRAVEFNITNGISVGDGAVIASGSIFVDHNHTTPRCAEELSSPIHIGKRVWIGAGVSVLMGVSIGDDAVVGAGSVVTKSIPSGGIYAGVPAKEIPMKTT